MGELQKSSIEEFKAHFRGDVQLPGDAGYDEARQIWNATIDRKPGSRSAAAATTSRAMRSAMAA
jgi:hypothetical protein